MGWWRWVWRRMEVLFRKQASEEELDEELRFHIEMEIRDHVAHGMSPEDARRAALLAFGGVERFKEEVRDVRGARVLDDLVQDVRVALRALPREPIFALTVIVTLALGIGGAVAMFGVLEASILGALPFPEADRLVLARTTFDGRLGPVSSAYDFADYRARSRTLERLGAIAPFPRRVTVRGAEGPVRADQVTVSHDFFRALGVEPLLGRQFLPEEEEAGAEAVVMLSHAYWRARHVGDPDVLGRVEVIDGVPMTVVGVMPPGFRFWIDADLWTPFRMGSGFASGRQQHNFLLVGRLDPSSTLRSAQAEMDLIATSLAAEYPDNQGKALLVTSLRTGMTESYQGVLRVFVAAVLLLLVVACANVAGLLLSRGSARTSEIAIRGALGARRTRLLRQLLTENAVLAGMAGLAGIVSARWLEAGILGFVEMDRLGPLEAGISVPTLVFALALSALTVGAFGVVPALRLSRGTGELRGGTRLSAAPGASRARHALVATQVGLSVVLLALSGLLIRSFERLSSVELGFRADALLTADVQLPPERPLEERIDFFIALAGRAKALPGVEAVTVADRLPVRDPGNNVGLWREGDPENAPVVHSRTIAPGYFEAMEIGMISGRGVDLSDTRDTEPVIVLSRATSTRLFGEEDPIGQVVLVESFGGDPSPHRVVGIVADVILGDLSAGPDLAMYFAIGQRAPSRMRVALRGALDAGTAAGIRDLASELDPAAALDRVVMMDEAIARSLEGRRAIVLVVGLFGVLSLVVTAVGLYGLVAYQVASRRREIGLRMALGATSGSVSRSVVGQGLRLVAIGVLLGIPATLASRRLVSGLLFGIGAADPMTLVLVCAFTGLVAVLASALPAWRASRLDPSTALRQD